jgi:hypothetical protein
MGRGSVQTVGVCLKRFAAGSCPRSPKGIEDIKESPLFQRERSKLVKYLFTYTYVIIAMYHQDQILREIRFYFL